MDVASALPDCTLPPRFRYDECHSLQFHGLGVMDHLIVRSMAWLEALNRPAPFIEVAIDPDSHSTAFPQNGQKEQVT